MTKPSQSGYKHLFYNQNINRTKSRSKYKNATESFIRVLKKLKKEGETKLLVNEKIKMTGRLKFLGISDEQITTALQRKGLKDLISNTYSS